MLLLTLSLLTVALCFTCNFLDGVPIYSSAHFFLEVLSKQAEKQVKVLKLSVCLVVSVFMTSRHFANDMTLFMAYANVALLCKKILNGKVNNALSNKVTSLHLPSLILLWGLEVLFVFHILPAQQSGGLSILLFLIGRLSLLSCCFV